MSTDLVVKKNTFRCDRPYRILQKLVLPGGIMSEINFCTSEMEEAIESMLMYPTPRPES